MDQKIKKTKWKKDQLDKLNELAYKEKGHIQWDKHQELLNNINVSKPQAIRKISKLRRRRNDAVKRRWIVEEDNIVKKCVENVKNEQYKNFWATVASKVNVIFKERKMKQRNMEGIRNRYKDYLDTDRKEDDTWCKKDKDEMISMIKNETKFDYTVFSKIFIGKTRPFLHKEYKRIRCMLDENWSEEEDKDILKYQSEDEIKKQKKEGLFGRKLISVLYRYNYLNNK